MSSIEELLAGHPLFADLDQAIFEELAGRAHEVHLAADERLFRTGEPAIRFYLVRHGRIALDLAAGGGDRLTVDTYGAGSLVGLSWLVPPYRWYLDARAVEPTDVVSLDATFLRSRCDEDPRLGYQLLQRVAREMYQRMQSARVRLLDVYGPSGAH